LLEQGHSVTGYFYNPNIHPLAEYLKRRDGAGEVAAKYGLPMIWAMEEGDYDTAGWLNLVYGQAEERCPRCWQMRLDKCLGQAKNLGFDAFSTTLLYSIYQNHERIRQLAEQAGTGHEKTPTFYYRDFRTDWQEGVDISKEWGIYRQKYCGCIFSENESQAKPLARSNLRLNSEKAVTS
jgi:predicted adenine nucleotide alpha hydrolase (AANH) superfamily ATPase